MDAYLFDDQLMNEALEIFMESEYKTKFKVLDLQLNSFLKKYPELRSAEGAIFTIKKNLNEISKDPYFDDAETSRKCIYLLNIIYDLWRKYESWFTVVKLGTTAVGTVLGGPVLGIAIMTFDEIILRVVSLVLDAIIQYFLVDIQYELAAYTLRQMISELNNHKRDCIKRRDKKNAATCDKMLTKANNALAKLYK